ncbi:MAG: N-acetyltransferase [Clostridia bacterium]|nr:N-acetyltransferase [Clostridia bacterium]
MIRDAKREDLPGILEIYAPYVTESTVSFEYEVPSLKAFEERFERITAFYPWLVCEIDGKVVGYAYLSRAFERKAYRFMADLSVYVDLGERGKGYGRALVEKIEEIAKKQRLCAIYAIVTEENGASKAFHEKMGYERMAIFPQSGYKFGKWLSVLWYRKKLFDGNPEELLSYREVE